MKPGTFLLTYCNLSTTFINLWIFYLSQAQVAGRGLWQSGAALRVTDAISLSLSLGSPAPTNPPWRRRTSPSSWTRSRETLGSTRSCSHACGRTKSKLWWTNTSPVPQIQTEVRFICERSALRRTSEHLNVSLLFVRRSDLSRRPPEFPDGAGDVSRHAGQAGQVSGHDPTLTALLHQVLPQHVSDRLAYTSSMIPSVPTPDLGIIDGRYLSPCSWSVLWGVLSGDVPPVSAVRLPLSGAGLLEGQTSRRRAHHYPWLHHDEWDPFQGVSTAQSFGCIFCRSSYTLHFTHLHFCFPLVHQSSGSGEQATG